jgi:hypothetical protein
MEQSMVTNYEQEWQIFLLKLNDYANDSPEKWNHYTLLSYFLVKYKSVNNIDFVFTFNKKGPTSSRELKQASKIWAMFDGGRLKKITDKDEKLEYREKLVSALKSYINWAFDVKFRGRQTNITGLGLLAESNFMNEFRQWYKVNKNPLPKRSDLLPVVLKDWIKDNAPAVLERQSLATLEDLNHLLNYVEAYDKNNESPEAAILNYARELGIMPGEGRLELSKK